MEVTKVSGKKLRGYYSPFQMIGPCDLQDRDKCQDFDVVTLQDCRFRHVYRLPALHNTGPGEEVVTEALYSSYLLFVHRFDVLESNDLPLYISSK